MFTYFLLPADLKILVTGYKGTVIDFRLKGRESSNPSCEQRTKTTASGIRNFYSVLLRSVYIYISYIASKNKLYTY